MFLLLWQVRAPPFLYPSKFLQGVRHHSTLYPIQRQKRPEIQIGPPWKVHSRDSTVEYSGTIPFPKSGRVPVLYLQQEGGMIAPSTPLNLEIRFQSHPTPDSKRRFTPIAVQT